MMLALVLGAMGATPVLNWDLEQDDGGFMAGGDLGQWEWGAVSGGPGGGFLGQNAWAVGLDGTYLNDSVEYLELPVLPLSGLAQPVLNFAHWYQLGFGDLGYLEVNDGFGWALLDPIYGYPAGAGYAGVSGGWLAASYSLSGLADGARVRFVFVADESGVGSGWYIDEVGVWDGDVTPPLIVSLEQLPDTELYASPMPVMVAIEDDEAVASATLWWTVNGESGGSAPLAAIGGNMYAAEISAQPPDSTVAYWAEATDGTNGSRFPVAGALSYRVYLPAPGELRGPSGRVVASEATLTWSAPTTVHEVLDYQVERAGVIVAETTQLEATVELAGSFDVFSVRARYAAGLGDPTASLEIDAVVPQVTAIEPTEAWPGDTIRATVHGDYLLLVQGQVALSLGSDVEVSGVEVIDVDHFVANLSIQPEAGAGSRVVTVTSPSGVATLEDAFSVLPPGGKPGLRSAEPDAVEQGQVGELVIFTSGSIGSPASVSLGADIVVESVVVEPTQIVVTYAVAPNAGLGKRQISVDDGTRVLDGVSLEVEDYRPPSIGTCSAIPGRFVSFFPLFAGFGLLRRRRLPSDPKIVSVRD
jgi:hypothetical protein